jgi:hypothetical protein
MLTAEKCRLYAAKSKLLGSINIPTERSVQQSMMSIKWSALADQIDRDNLTATMSAFYLRRIPRRL